MSFNAQENALTRTDLVGVNPWTVACLQEAIKVCTGGYSGSPDVTHSAYQSA